MLFLHRQLGQNGVKNILGTKFPTATCLRLKKTDDLHEAQNR